MEEPQKSKEWLCGGCQKRFETKERLLEHQNDISPIAACQKGVNSGESKPFFNGPSQASQRKEREFQKLLKKDRIKNPTLALISDHLWWLAFLAKLGLISILISVGLSLIFMGG